MVEETGSVKAALDESAKILSLAGRVIPVTFEKLSVEARFENGRKAAGRKPFW